LAVDGHRDPHKSGPWVLCARIRGTRMRWKANGPAPPLGAPGRMCLGSVRQAFGGFFPGLVGDVVGLVRCR
jgi:hypothetical protein